MNDSFDSSSLSMLLTSVVDGVATAEERTLLNELLAGSEEARRFYVQQMLQRALLIQDAGCTPASAEATSETLRSLQAVSPSPLTEEASSASPSPLMGEGRGEGSSAFPAPPAKPVKSPVLGFLGGVIDYVSHSRMLMFWLMFAVLGTFFIAHFGSLMLSRFWAQRNEQLVQNGGAGQHPGGPAAHPDGPAGKIVARLTNAIDCKWNPPSGANGAGQPQSIELALDTEFTAGQELNLTAGLAELTFDSGAKVILHAPVQFAVSEALGGELQLGRLTARVPHSAHGFTINTPGGRVVDLGTEFGVKVNLDRSMRVTVFVGDVVVQSPAGPGGNTQEPVHVHAGEAISVGPNQPLKSIDPANERFVRELAPLGNTHEAEAAYVEFVKKLKPVVWFRMEGKSTDRVLHDEMGGPDAKLLWDGPGNPFVKGAIGKSLWLRGPQLKDCAIAPDYRAAEHGKLTVAAWVYADSRPYDATIVDHWGGGGQFRFGLFGKDAQGYAQDLCAYVSQANGQPVFVHEGDAHLFPLNQWQHVAFTTDGTTLRIYRQGHEVGSVRHSGLAYPVPRKSLAIGIQANQAGDAAGPDPFYWSGKIDEVAVFHSSLTADDIRRLAGAAPR